MRVLAALAVVVVGVLLCLGASGVVGVSQFSLEPNVKTCFASEASQDSNTVTMHYIVHGTAGTLALNVLTPARANSVTTNLETGGKDVKTFTFQTAMAGRWDMCLTWLGSYAVRMELDVEASVDMNFRDPAIKADDYSVITDKLLPLFEKADVEIDYFTNRQERFEATVKSTYFRVVFFTVFEVFVMAGAVGWQIWSLRRFFKEKKVV